ncbi:MAG: T9SS type A sorting domain-containing protein [Ignavibacteria bacterium]|nr:T9SS type A sorting domain-containing protein [Ignavibacteria bacterium]
MNKLFLFISFLFVSYCSLAENRVQVSLKKKFNFPEVSIHDIQFVHRDSLRIADSLQNSNPSRWTLQVSPYLGDTITVTALCVIPSKVITYTAAGFTMLLGDTSGTGISKPWHGLLVRISTADSSQAILDGFLNVQRGDIVKMTGLISEFPTNSMNSTTQFQPIPGIPVEIVGSGDVPDEHLITVDSIYVGLFPNGKVKYSSAEQFEGVQVKIVNTIVNAIVNASRGTFAVVDASSNNISEYDISHFFTLGHGNPVIPGDSVYIQQLWPKIQVGTLIDTIRGTISSASGQENQRGYRICPLLPGDVVIGVRKIQVYSHRRYPVIVTPDSSARITCIVKEGDNAINSVQLLYRTNNNAFQSLSMVATSGDTIYEATIPQLANNSYVNYFIKATDDENYVTILSSSASDGSQNDTSKGFFFYTVLNRALSIYDVQYTPFLNGRSAYLGAITSVSGYVTADTAYMMLSPRTTGGTSAWYLQDSSSAWNGIWIVGPESLLAPMKNNDNVTVTGSIQESNNVTRIASVSSVTINSNGNPKRIPIKLKTGRFGPSVGNGNQNAEPYEGVLVKFDSVTVTSVNPTFADVTEYEVDDGTGPLLIRRDGRNTYSNIPGDDTLYGYTVLHVGSKIGTLLGLVYFGNNRYKLAPRTNSDFMNVQVGVIERQGENIPKEFSLKQNYPNPFNPSTNFEFSLSTSQFVKLKIFDVLGREMATVVNENLNAGTYNVHYDASQLPSGVYFYRLSAGTFSDVKKMIVLK